MYCILLLIHAIFPIELINTSTRLCSLLLACVEWMAFGTDFNVNILFCRTCHECIATVTCHSCLMVIWMDSFSHVIHLAFYLYRKTAVGNFPAHYCIKIKLFMFFSINSFYSITYQIRLCKQI